MIGTLGVIGTGHLADFVVAGLRASGWEGRIHAASRDREKARAFCRRHGAELEDGNQAVVDATEAVLVAVRPAQTEAALTGLRWRAGQRLVSAMAGVKVERLAALAPDAIVVRSMPISSAAVCASPTTIFPDDPAVADLFDRVGTAVPIASETEFEAANTNAAAYGWYFGLMDEMIRANEAAGLSPASARAVAVETLASATKVMLSSDASGADILKGLMTPGGITEQGALILRDRDAFAPWRDAFAAVAQRLKTD